MNNRFLLIIICLLTTVITERGAHAADDQVDYLKKIKPILSTKCYSCHGALKQEAELRLETQPLMLSGGDSGKVIIPGNADESLLIERIASHDDDRMPPPEDGGALTAEEISLIRSWINQGALTPQETIPGHPRDHWAFTKPVRAKVPEVKNSQWSHNPIDAFLAAKHEELHLVPVELAEKQVLLRRIYLDLIGLPPTREQLQAFLKNESPDAYGQVVDELLQSPQYGERWGRHWMDVWRYSDWYGLGKEVRYSQKHIWRWRDWIVESLNEDKPYNRMITEMLAGDEIAPHDPKTLRATGFLVRNYFIFNRTTWLDNTVEHTSKAFLGLTMNCTKCHDHKFDPISQNDYYRMRAIFEPYQVRMDPVPGETDFNKDGLPRIFDANPETPTYLFVRGDPKTPDKSRVIQPGTPAVLTHEEFKAIPVSLSPEVFHPSLQQFVLEDNLKLSQTAIETAKAASEKASQQFKTAQQSATELAAKQKSTTPATNKLFLKDDFDKANPEAWETGDGNWKFSNGKLTQSKTGASRHLLRTRTNHPVDFQARLKLKITGGDQWRSVGLSFDQVDGRDKHVYISAVSPGSKIHVIYNAGAGIVYPAEGALARPINLDETYELTISVRNQLVNVAINGKHAIAYELPVKREPGKIELVSFDSVVEFDSLEIRELPKDVVLVSTKPLINGDIAKLEVTAAQKTLLAATLHPEMLRTAHAADVAKFSLTPPQELPQLIAKAVTATDQYEVAKADQAVALAQLTLAKSDEKTKEASQTALKKTKDNLAKKQTQQSKPTDKYTSLKVSVKAADGYPEHVAGDAARRGPYSKISTGRRTSLANWIGNSNNPLTARVAVNHIWLRHFGQPLVDSVSDFGLRAKQPIHHALLDWLAVELMENNWSMKHIHHLIVSSRSYQASSIQLNADQSTIKTDPQNQYYWKRNSVRMESQVVRDSLLHLAGVLDASLGGPTVSPAKEDTVFRRSLYFTHSRDDRGKFIAVFDDANIIDCYRRDESIIPQQALAMANSKLALSMSRRISTNLQQELGNPTDQQFITAAFEKVLLTKPTSEEIAVCLETIQLTTRILIKQKHTEPEKRAKENLIHALLNHNDFVTIR